MKPSFFPAGILTLGVSLAALCASPNTAHAGDWYNDTCTSVQGGETWTLSLSTTGDHVVELWRDTGNPRVRVGTFTQDGDDVVAHLEDITTLHLHAAYGDASWFAGPNAKGTFSCLNENYTSRRSH